MFYLEEREALVVVTAEEMLEAGQAGVRRVGGFGAGVRAAACSPGQDLLVLVVGDQMLALNAEFDPVQEAPLDDRGEECPEG
jgi:hypothetical protein